MEEKPEFKEDSILDEGADNLKEGNNEYQEKDPSLLLAQVFNEEITSMINETDVQTILNIQKEIYEKLKNSVQGLTSFNEHSAAQYIILSKEYDKHIRMLKEMKKDLEIIFKKIRVLKNKVNARFPEAMDQFLE